MFFVKSYHSYLKILYIWIYILCDKALNSTKKVFKIYKKKIKVRSFPIFLYMFQLLKVSWQGKKSSNSMVSYVSNRVKTHQWAYSVSNLHLSTVHLKFGLSITNIGTKSAIHYYTLNNVMCDRAYEYFRRHLLYCPKTFFFTISNI